jgi:peptidoglycan/xylan/chitin deacetylase (PgdA/CDA1 family)
MSVADLQGARWPRGRQFAVAFTFDFDAEEVWIGEDPKNADRPGVLSQGTYGAKVAVPLLLEMLSRLDTSATFFVPGRVAERHANRVEEIVAAGHELAHHGYTHTSPAMLTPEQEEAELIRGKQVLEAFGAPVTGYRAPSWEFSTHTLQLLGKHGFTYSSNLMDDIRPYRHPGTEVLELPVHWLLDDAPHFWFDNTSWTKKISTNDEVRQIWQAELEGIGRLGGLCVFTMHPQIIGRPGRLAFLERFVRFVKDQPEAWIATLGEVAAACER